MTQKASQLRGNNRSYQYPKKLKFNAEEQGESGGRARFHYLSSLRFKEFLEFKEEKIPEREEFEIYQRKVEIRLREFMYKGFPETLEMGEKKRKQKQKAQRQG